MFIIIIAIILLFLWENFSVCTEPEVMCNLVMMFEELLI